MQIAFLIILTLLNPSVSVWEMVAEGNSIELKDFIRNNSDKSKELTREIAYVDEFRQVELFNLLHELGHTVSVDEIFEEGAFLAKSFLQSNQFSETNATQTLFHISRSYKAKKLLPLWKEKGFHLPLRLKGLLGDNSSTSEHPNIERAIGLALAFSFDQSNLDSRIQMFLQLLPFFNDLPAHHIIALLKAVDVDIASKRNLFQKQ